MKNRMFTHSVVLAGLVALVAGPARADYTPGDHSGWYRFAGVVTPSLYGYVGGDGLTGYENAYWSTYNLDKGTAIGLNKWATTDTVRSVACIDMVQVAHSTWKWYEDVDLTAAPLGSANQVMDQTQAKRLRELWTDHYAELNTTVNRAAFQLAVWEIVYQRDVAHVTDYDVRAGWVSPNGFQARSSSGSSGSNYTAAETANAWLWSLNGSTFLGDNTYRNVRALVNSTTQDWAFYSPDMGLIPAPGAVLLGMIGLGIVGWIKRRCF